MFGDARIAADVIVGSCSSSHPATVRTLSWTSDAVRIFELRRLLGGDRDRNKHL